MIISASRRTDIPAFYSGWFFNRIKEGYLLTVNPMNRKQISRVSLDPSVIDCIVFWSKNPSPMIGNLDLLKSYTYYFQFTLTPYSDSIEINVPSVSKSIETFRKLSSLIGPERIIWRYDPIYLSDKFSIEYHLYHFKDISAKLKGCTNKCVISFLDVYKKCERNMKNLSYMTPDTEQIFKLASRLSEISSHNNMRLETCAEEVDLRKFGIEKGKCIDDVLISNLLGCENQIEKDKNQRVECGCVSSIDIGTYNSCLHNCLYCYANFNHDIARKIYHSHDPQSEILTGHLKGDEKISVKKMQKLFNVKSETHFQMSLF